MTDAQIRAALGPVRFEPSCVVELDDSEIVRHAAPMDAHAAAQMREQFIARLRRDDAAVAQRERRIAIARGNVTPIRRRA